MLVPIDIRQIALKQRSKHEMYQRMIVEGKMYLPKEADANSDYIADILQGRKRQVDGAWSYRNLLGSAVTQVRVPHVKGLRVADIMEFASEQADFLGYLPEYKTQRYSSRE
jgi:hypothetical protein